MHPRFPDEVTEEVSRMLYCHPEVGIPERSSQKDPEGSSTPGGGFVSHAAGAHLRKKTKQFKINDQLKKRQITLKF